MEDTLHKIGSSAFSRRGFLAGAGAVTATTLSGCGDDSPVTSNIPTPPTAPSTVSDVDILNFALNLEYLEAEFYLRGATGQGLPSSLRGSGAGSVNIAASTKVDFGNALLQDLANEIAQQEVQHIQAIQAAITAKGGTPIAAPAMDYTAAFSNIAFQSGIGSFNPFADAMSFFVAALAFEDVGVTAYTGTAALIKDTTVLSAAASIQAAEAYHAGLMRTVIAMNASTTGNNKYRVSYGQIQQLRAKLSGGTGETILNEGSVDSKGNVTPATLANVDTKTARAYTRTTDQVMHVVFGTQPGDFSAKGGFFPNGLNGTIKQPTT